MLHAGGAPAFLYCGPRPCAAALERCACRKAAGRACPAPTFYAGERFTPPRGVFRCHRRARSGQDRSLQTTRYRCIAGRDDRLSKKVCSPLGPLCEGAPPAGGGGENCTASRNISGYGKVLSLRPFGAPPSQREVFRHAEGRVLTLPYAIFCFTPNARSGRLASSARGDAGRRQDRCRWRCAACGGRPCLADGQSPRPGWAGA